ncbi:AP-4 complex subunit epsilon-1 [Frankliniella fusca]|uniref:AP-4 complex subunit epsilon-1 n=1 Tax=Frankliniella fusca TaxID=407009 RepID=A0AAE1HF20_9NEOP|nr:AP-4 complex subunit epsilon-1 [Frankliniella fusca]
MSGILEKTIESLNTLLSPLSTSVGLSTKNMFERCMSARTKREEEWCFQDSLRSIQERLSEPAVRPSAVKKMLSFVVFAEMMGYRAEFAYIHAVKLAQRGSLAEKKMGYMVCVQLLKDSHQLSMLLVNTIIRDLASRNMVTIAMALAATCHLIPADQASSVLPMVADKLTHSNEYIRGKAVIVLHHFLRTCPSQAVHYIHRVRALLGDSDPGVVAFILQYLLDLRQEEEEVTKGLCSSVVSIQEQILHGKLPKDYLHHGASAPWTQLTIIKLIRQLRPPILEVQKILQDTYKAALGDGNIGSSSNLSAAIAIECLVTMIELGVTTSTFKSLTMTTIGNLLISHNMNYRYEGLNLLQTLISNQHVNLTRDQQSVVMRCLQHPDNAIKIKTLHLLCKIADSSSAESICDQIIDFLKNHCKNSLLQDELVSLGISLAEKYPSDANHWHLAALLRLLPVAKEQSGALQAHLKLALLANPEKKSYAAHEKVLLYLTKHSESKVAPTSILELYVWMLSNFHFLLVKDDDTSFKKSHVLALEKIVALGHKVYVNQIQTSLEIVSPRIHKLIYEIVVALKLLVGNNFESTPSLVRFLKDIIAASLTRVFGDAALRCLCNDLLCLISSCSELSVLNESKTEPPDFTLSFLDDFVCQSLEEGSLPYRALPAKPGSRAAVELAIEIERNHGEVELYASNLVAEGCSLGSSVLSLAGTESANNRDESVSSASSTESKCWTFTSPTQEIALMPVWTKEGRIKGDDSTEGDSSFSASASGPSDEVSTELMPGPSISSWLQKSMDEDPLDNLQKDFNNSFDMSKSQKVSKPS